MTNDNFNKDLKELEKSVSHGVSFDTINLRTVSFWIVFGILLVTISLIGVYNMFTYNRFLSSQEAAISAVYHDLEQRREREDEKLNSFELIDEENQRYRIPIDSAMSLIATDRSNNAQP